jgi:hypothetical protein
MTERVLDYDHGLVGQETGYNCGPASAQVTLSCRGIYVEEWVLAQECGTDQDGTDYVGLIENCLDPRLPEANYTSVDAPNDPPTDDQRARCWDGIRRSIDAGYAVVMNWVVPGSNRPQGVKGSSSPNYGNYTTYHYVTCVGYDDEFPGGAVCIADSGFQPPQYWIAFDQCATLIPPKALCYADVPGAAPEGGAPDYALLDYEQLCGPVGPNGYGTGWPQLGQNEVGDNLYLVDAVSDILHTLEGGKAGAHPRSSVATAADPPNYVQLGYEQTAGPVKEDGYGHGWPQLGGRSLTDAVAHIKNVLQGSPPFPPSPPAGSAR